MVTVIIPAYNVENYIERCLDSVSKQTYGNIQVIVVDDGSQDATLQKAESFESNISMRVFSQTNSGVSSVRNRAIDLAEGEYIYFLDADDVLEPDAIRTLVEAMESSDYDWVSCQYSRWDESGKRLEDYDFITGEFCFDDDNERLSFLTGILLGYKVGFEVWDKLFKASIIRDNDIRFSEKCKIGEDLGFNIKYLMNCCRLKCIPDRPIRYTVRSNSAMGNIVGLSQMISENIMLSEDVFEYVHDSNKEFYIEHFPCIFVRIFENSYIGSTPEEVSKALGSIPDISFVIERYRDLGRCRQEIMQMYTQEVSKIKYRYHLRVRSAIDSRYIFDKCFLSAYGVYRRLRGMKPLEDWEMPY